MTSTAHRYYYKASAANHNVQGEETADEQLDPYTFHTKVLPSYKLTNLIRLKPNILSSLDLTSWLQIHVKDGSKRFHIPAFKTLGASYAIFLALCQKYNLDISTTTLQDLINKEQKTILYAATYGNHSRTVARIPTLLQCCRTPELKSLLELDEDSLVVLISSQGTDLGNNGEMLT